MAIGATAVWRVRTGGNNANGSGYDPGIGGAGSDYTQQDTAQASWTGLSMAGSTTLTDSNSTSLFTSAMVGNAVNVNSQFYFVTGFTDSNHVTVDRSDTFAATAGKLGGASATFQNILNSANAANAKAVPGNTVYLRHGTGTTGSPDYSQNGRITLVSGNTTAGNIQIIGENGMPIVANTGADLLFLSPTYNYFDNLYFFQSVNSGGLFLFYTDANATAVGCVFDLNNTATGVNNGGGGSAFLGCEVKGGATAALSGNKGFQVGGNGGFLFGNNIHDTGDVAATLNGWSSASYNIIRNAWGNSLTINSTSTPISVTNNTIDNGKSSGIVFTGQSDVPTACVINNIVSNHTGASKSGIVVTSGTAATSDAQKGLIDYNCVYNNTTNYSNISAGAHDVNTDPKFTNQSTGDYRLQSTSPAIAAGFPGAFLNGGNNTGYLDMGALQHQATGGGGGGLLVHPGMAGGMRG